MIGSTNKREENNLFFDGNMRRWEETISENNKKLRAAGEGM